MGMPDYGAAVRGQNDQSAAVFLASRRSGFGMVVVVMDLVAVRMVGEQCAHMDVAVPWLPAGVVVVQHGPDAGQQRDRRGGRCPGDRRNEAPDRRESHG